jgi:ParB-like chromosome segregation protein Spo0J
MEQDAPLPAIEVYQLGERYYVLDGNHRVAAARWQEQLEIDAVVTAFTPHPGQSGR